MSKRLSKGVKKSGLEGGGAGAFQAHGRDDGCRDVLTGDGGRDWFPFNSDAGVEDRVTDLSAFEQMFAEDVDFLFGP